MVDARAAAAAQGVVARADRRLRPGAQPADARDNPRQPCALRARERDAFGARGRAQGPDGGDARVPEATGRAAHAQHDPLRGTRLAAGPHVQQQRQARHRAPQRARGGVPAQVGRRRRVGRGRRRRALAHRHAARLAGRGARAARRPRTATLPAKRWPSQRPLPRGARGDGARADRRARAAARERVRLRRDGDRAPAARARRARRVHAHAHRARAQRRVRARHRPGRLARHDPPARVDAVGEQPHRRAALQRARGAVRVCADRAR